MQKAAPVAETQAKAGEKAKAVDEISTVAAPSEYLAKDAPKAGRRRRQENRLLLPSLRPAPAARPQPTPSREADKNEAVAKQNEAAAGDTLLEMPEPSDKPLKIEKLFRAVAKQRLLEEVARLAQTGARRSETKQKRADQDAEIREVAGRRFQRQGNTWIDVDYDAGRPAMTVVRGSEQYRALVADEPGIRTIAERLAGEVIVVWKGRAYRIR